MLYYVHQHTVHHNHNPVSDSSWYDSETASNKTVAAADATVNPSLQARN